MWADEQIVNFDLLLQESMHLFKFFRRQFPSLEIRLVRRDDDQGAQMLAHGSDCLGCSWDELELFEMTRRDMSPLPFNDLIQHPIPIQKNSSSFFLIQGLQPEYFWIFSARQKVTK